MTEYKTKKLRSQLSELKPDLCLTSFCLLLFLTSILRSNFLLLPGLSTVTVSKKQLLFMKSIVADVLHNINVQTSTLPSGLGLDFRLAKYLKVITFTFCYVEGFHFKMSDSLYILYEDSSTRANINF